MRKKSRLKHYFMSLLIFLGLIVLSSTALAAGGNGSGGGNGTGGGAGGGSEEPLTLSSSNPADGQKDVAVGTSIKLVFSKNVTNMSVKENNQKCFSLSAGSEIVPVKVVIADDQVEPEKKETIEIVPESQLKAGTSYKLKISGDLKAKSGAALGKETTVAFTTAGSATAESGKSTVTGTGSNNSIKSFIIPVTIILILIIAFTGLLLRKRAK